MVEKVQNSGNSSGASSGKSTGIANLKPWKKGQSGNPNGKGKGVKNLKTLFTEALEIIAAKDEKSGEEYDNAQLIVKSVVKKAKLGDLKAVEIVFDRFEGKAIQKTQQEIVAKVDFNLVSEEKKARLRNIVKRI